jgi:3-hydroxymyristoyl/3-hydroxydecanoyl-(acyl carrier protein) dehydratase
MKLSKKEIINLLPHRDPMLLIDELIDIKKLHSATAIMYVKKMLSMLMVIFQEIQLCQVYLL